MMNKAIILLFIFINIVFVYTTTPSFQIDNQATVTLIKQYNQSQLYEISSFGYAQPIYVANLTGTSYEMGYAYGYFFAEAIVESYHSLLDNVLPNQEAQDVLELFLDWQFKDFLSKQLPQQYFDELRGLSDGANEAGMPDVSVLAIRTMTIANFPGDIQSNIEYLLENEAESLVSYLFTEEYKNIIESGKFVRVLEQLALSGFKGWQCSHFSVWGDRTVNGDMFNGRNLDWFPGTGISQHKVLAVYHPTTGGSAFLNVGFAGLLGSITGISANGIFVAESDSDTRPVTFDGFAWTLRLRYVMQYASTIEEALNIWRTTNNTFGMNHMLSSAFEANTVQHPAYALETMKGYTAYFPDNDPSEVYYYKDTGVQMGYPIPQAVYRTNHGYDQRIRQEQTFVPAPGDDTMVRYFLFHDNFEYFGQQNAIGDLAAVNITSILGDKNNTDFYDCSEAYNGANVVSATFHSQTSTMYIAYEEGSGAQRKCACCGVYVKIDLAQWFGSSIPSTATRFSSSPSVNINHNRNTKNSHN
ncbi:hypothetical protein PPL_05470 [Heterostelium album PN500]|uniref:Uncharacterized protein n=1 Tax=Heterostelium pallidum (strain ATCC 26659 / Pp 5 / PN500) TaxID=670386 RepID=D3BA95_HETP5|nr:hypothetical protein PPL_05470 [Heterostelium album PN500]EFA81482.1 hypothetical protein PPL_05470 [Heterostelium album PN500]|eukprot:XP_020433600.1 hypothetical protein PPL_05470 [Heterostelium album PN500]